MTLLAQYRGDATEFMARIRSAAPAARLLSSSRRDVTWSMGDPDRPLTRYHMQTGETAIIRRLGAAGRWRVWIARRMR